jgi:hypothetical protein
MIYKSIPYLKLYVIANIRGKVIVLANSQDFHQSKLKWRVREQVTGGTQNLKSPQNKLITVFYQHKIGVWVYEILFRG